MVKNGFWGVTVMLLLAQSKHVCLLIKYFAIEKKEKHLDIERNNGTQKHFKRWLGDWNSNKESLGLY